MLHTVVVLDQRTSANTDNDQVPICLDTAASLTKQPSFQHSSVILFSTTSPVRLSLMEGISHQGTLFQ